MQDPFDPYLQWLDIPAGDRPPNHYDLLGVAMFSDDLQAIAQAADARMAKIRKIRPGPRLADWGRLLDKINAAKVCLSNPTSKAAYDASLGGHAAARSKPSTLAAPATPQTSAPTGMPWQSPTPAALSPVALPQGNLPLPRPANRSRNRVCRQSPGCKPGLQVSDGKVQSPSSPGRRAPVAVAAAAGFMAGGGSHAATGQPASGQHILCRPGNPSSLPLDSPWGSADSASQQISPSSIGPTASGVVAIGRRGAAGRKKSGAGWPSPCCCCSSSRHSAT